MSQQDKQPHDKFFREAFSRIEVAKDYLENFIPENISRKLDLDKLELQQESYITPALQDYYSDKVYTCLYNGKTEVTITFLLEHKSYPPPYPHFQLLRYMLEIWEHQLKNPVDKKTLLTPILPVIIYHGQQKWKYKPLENYFKGIDEDLKPYIPSFLYHLTDLSHYSDEDLISLQIGFLFNTFLALKHYKEEDYIRQNFGLLLTLKEEDINGNFTKLILVYLLKKTEIKPPELSELLKQVNDHQTAVIMNSYDMLIEKGKIEGEKKGIAKGLAKGIAKAKIKEEKRLILTTRSMLLKKLSIDLIAEVQDLTKEYVQQIQVALKQEKKIIQLLKTKKTTSQIAKQLKVSTIFVEAIKDLQNKKKRKPK